MSLAITLIVTLLLLKALHTLYKNWTGPWKDAPPGPPFFPFLGSTPSFASAGLDALRFPVLAIDHLAKQYGDVMRVSMGSNHMVFLSGLTAIKEYCSKDETTFRPLNRTLLEMYSNGQEAGMGIGLGGERWREQRKFVVRALKDLGQGSAAEDIETRIQKEIEVVIEDIKQRASKLTDVDRYFDLPDLNIIWGMVAAIRYDYDDPEIQKQFEYLRSFLGESLAGPLTATPWLKYVHPFRSVYWNIRQAMNNFRILINRVVEEQRATFDEGHVRGYIDKFIVEQNKQTGKYFTNTDLVRKYLFIGGSETTSKTLSNCILRMVLHPNVQKKVQNEIDRVIGRERNVVYSDKAKLPYTEAVLYEVRRIATPFPITPPRTAHRDIYINGYRIPAGTSVQMNIYSVLRGEKYFDDPDQFRPERFLSPDNKLIMPEGYIPFGYGKRKCIGENLAAISNFLFLANLLQAFDFRCVDPLSPPGTLPHGGLTYGPQPFDVQISVRE